MKTVYACMCADIIHSGHINLIKRASEHGNLIVGLLTDSGVSTYKPSPIMNWDERKAIVENIKGVHLVIPQDSLDYEMNLRKYKPDFVVHGDDWESGVQKELGVKCSIEEIVSEWNGKVISLPYTKGISSSEIKQRIINEHTQNTTQ